MFAVEVPGGGREVVGGHGGEGEGSVFVLVAGSVDGGGAFKPEDGGAHDAAGGEDVLDPLFESS